MIFVAGARGIGALVQRVLLIGGKGHRRPIAVHGALGKHVGVTVRRLHVACKLRLSHAAETWLVLWWPTRTTPILVSTLSPVVLFRIMATTTFESMLLI